MSKTLSLGLAILTLAFAVSTASAAVTSTPATLAITDVITTANSETTGTVSLSASPAVTVDLAVGAGCAAPTAFTITPSAAVDLTTAKTITIGYKAAGIPDVVCTIDVKDGAVIVETITVTGKGIAPILGVSPMMVAFGAVRHHGTAKSSSSFVISNTGNAPLTVQQPTLGAPNGADFTVTTGGFPHTLAANSTLTVAVDFDPTTGGARSSALTLTSDDPVEATETVALSGTGTNAVIAVSDVMFGTVNAGAATTQGITINNTATTDAGLLLVTKATIASASTWFTFGASNGCTNGTTECVFGSGLAVPPTKTLDVKCTPPTNETGTRTATVTFESDSDAGGDAVATLTCTAGRADVTVASMALAFPNTLINTDSATQTITIKNEGNLGLTYNIVKTDGPPAQFVVTGCATACMLAPNATAVYSVKFHPTTVGAKTGSLSLTSNDPDNGTITISLAGTGTAPVASVLPTSLAFSTVEVGKSSPGSILVLTNTGGANLTISNAALTGANAASYLVPLGTTGAQTTVIMPGLSTMWTINCTPTTQGSLPANFVITSDTNAVAGSTTTVPLACTGQRGVLTVTPAAFDFAGVPAGESATHSFTLRNTGNVAVNDIAAALSNTTLGYSIESPTFPIATLAPNATATIIIKFAPVDGTDGGPITATFTGGWGVTPTTTTATLALDGDGLTAGFDVTPMTVAFGNIRFDTSPIKTFCIVNTSEAPVNITSITLALNGVTMANEIKILDLRRRPCGDTGAGTVIAYPIGTPVQLTADQTVEVRVQADPANRTGALGATIMVVSDLAIDATRTVTVTANSTTAMLAIDPSTPTVDFGATDLDGGPQTKSVKITNTGDAALDLSAFTRDVNPVFTVTLPANTTLLPTESVELSITYTPIVERPSPQTDSFVIRHSVAGVLAGPAMQMITVTGRGVDRHIDLGLAPVFPPTFRNPGSMAPTRNVTITNTGDADLNITGVMVTNGDVWQLQDTGPVTIPGQGSHDFAVTFVPTFAGKAPVGELVFINNDNTSAATMMAVVMLDGDGLDRQVSLIGDPVVLGITGIGIPITLDNGLVIASMDTTNTFAIREIQLVGDASAFRIDNAPDNAQIPPSTQLTFSVTFNPSSEGEFTARALLFLDEDPQQAAEVTLKGTAVFVDVGGGGGCSTGPGGGAGMLIVIGAMLFARRRKAVVLAATLAPSLAAAQAAELDLDLALFDHTPSTVGNTLQVQTADVGRDGEWVATAMLSNASNPLVLSFGGSDHMSISRRTTIEVGGAYAFLDRFEAGLRLPLYNQSGDENALGLEPPSGTSVGDLVAHARARLLRTGGAGQLLVGASLAVTFPTASDQQFAGIDKPSARVLALGQFTPAAFARRITVLGNVGGVIRAKSDIGNIEQGSGLAFGAAASFRVLNEMWAFGEVFGDVLPSARRPGAMESSQTLTTSEWLAGISFRPDPRMTVGVAAGRGLVSGIGTPDLRAVLTVAFAPGARELPPIHPPKPPPPDGDADRDGVRDSSDACADQAEDLDGFQDGDGCPDLDNDGDGVADAADTCPTEAEDKDGFEDADGCADPDNDHDGVLDAADKCPLATEDKDGFEDADGCPDKDNDKDGVDDALDKCPAQAETINGNADDDGCPDKGDGLIVVTPSAIEMLDSIQFSGPRLTKGSSNLLGQIGATLRAHPEILRVRLTVHVDPTSDAARDKKLTDDRANAMREWLIKWGVDSDRVSAVGFGGTKPLVTKRSQLNERVEIIILEKK